MSLGQSLDSQLGIKTKHVLLMPLQKVYLMTLTDSTTTPTLLIKRLALTLGL